MPCTKNRIAITNVWKCEKHIYMEIVTKHSKMFQDYTHTDICLTRAINLNFLHYLTDPIICSTMYHNFPSHIQSCITSVIYSNMDAKANHKTHANANIASLVQYVIMAVFKVL